MRVRRMAAFLADDGADGLFKPFFSPVHAAEKQCDFIMTVIQTRRLRISEDEAVTHAQNHTVCSISRIELNNDTGKKILQNLVAGYEGKCKQVDYFAGGGLQTTVCSTVLSPLQALYYLQALNEKMSGVSVVGMPRLPIPKKQCSILYIFVESALLFFPNCRKFQFVFLFIANDAKKMCCWVSTEYIVLSARFSAAQIIWHYL
jgi:hypothetical protein